MPGELGEALSPSPPSTADWANGQECQRCPNATLILFFFGVDTQGIYMRPASPTPAAVGQQTLELLQCPVWPGTGAGQTLPAMLPPSNPSSCHPQPATWARSATTYWRQFFIWVCLGFFSLLLPALSGFPLLLPELADSFPIAITSEARTRLSPLLCKREKGF